MKLSTSLLGAFLFLVKFAAFSQAGLQPPAATPQQLKTHTLEWITSRGDFDQTNLSTDAVDRQINDTIQRAICAGISIADIEIPFNHSKLVYRKQINPNTMPELAQENFRTNNIPYYDTLLHVYQYGKFFISTRNDTPVDQMNVYYTLRALHIIQKKYTEAFERLFTRTENYLAATPLNGNYLNSNKAYWIGFNLNPEAIASNNIVFSKVGTLPTNNNVALYKNISVVNIHESTIRGTSGLGSRPVYNRPNDWENYHLYMRDGLPVSVVHEMMHCYVQTASTVDAFQKKMFDARDAYNRRQAFFTRFMPAEEIAVVNSTYEYFSRKGGLLAGQENYYYPNIFAHYISNFNAADLNTFARVFSMLPVNPQNYRRIFLIPVLQ